MSYRLGDAYFIGQNMGPDEFNGIVDNHPNTIAADFLLSKKKWLSPSYRKIDVVVPIVQKYLKKYENLMPSNIEESTVIHLRLGDSLCGTSWHELLKRPKKAEDIKNIILRKDKNIDLDNVFVIGKAFFVDKKNSGGESTGNWDEGKRLSANYMNEILREFNATHFDGGSPDIDFCCGVMAKNFIQAPGHFSLLITQIRTKLGKKSVSPY